MQHDLAALSREVQSLRREVRGQRVKQRRSLMVAVVAVLIAAVSPVAAFAANPFNDLNAGSPHNGNIDAIYNAGITTGCDPNVSYCPNGLVTREEMASFLARTAGLGSNAPVVNAKTAVTAGQAATATNAEQLGGVAAADYVRTGASPTFGTITTTGVLQTSGSGAPYQATPIAFAIIEEDGTIINRTPSVESVAYNAVTRQYEIALTGGYDQTKHVTLVTPYNSFATSPRTGQLFSPQNRLIIDFDNGSQQSNFSFIVFQLP